MREPLRIEIDTVDRAQWAQLMTQFDDSCIDQTWSFACAARPRTKVSHLLLRQGADVVACCQTQLRRVPLLNSRIADVKWGPLICRRGTIPDFNLLSTLLRALKEEYGIKRGCFLRISPHVIGERKDEMKRLLEAESFKEDLSKRPYRTLMLDLAPPLEELRSNLLQRWRRHLNKAEKGNLVIIEGTNDDLFQIFLKLATEMCERKDLSSLEGYRHYRHIQQDLPDPLKMRIFVCQHANEPVAATIASAVGNTGIYMLGATGQTGLDLDASYLLHWRMIEWLKGVGVRYYDLGAINPELNPGGYQFKRGIAGRSGWDETFLRVHQAGFTWGARMTGMVLRYAALLRHSQ